MCVCIILIFLLWKYSLFVFADETTRGLEYGIKESVIKDFVLELLTKWKVIENYKERAYDAVSFQYTYWPDPTNDTARSQGFIDVSILYPHVALMCLTNLDVNWPVLRIGFQVVCYCILLGILCHD